MGIYSTLVSLADPLRFRIIEHLSHNERAVGELVLALEQNQPTVSKALRVLRDSELVSVRKVAQLRFYSLRRERFAELARWADALGVASAEAEGETQ